MASMKAKKGNPFEYDTAYSLQKGGYVVNRIDDNTKGIDLIAYYHTDKEKAHPRYIECKNREKLSWNTLVKFYNKTMETAQSKSVYVVFKSNRQPTLVMWKPPGRNCIITTFEDAFLCGWSKRPKGYKLWR